MRLLSSRRRALGHRAPVPPSDDFLADYGDEEIRTYHEAAPFTMIDMIDMIDKLLRKNRLRYPCASKSAYLRYWRSSGGSKFPACAGNFSVITEGTGF